MNDQIDLLFIDADHSYDAVKKDFELYAPLVSDGGLIVLHDVVNPRWVDNGVAKFWQEINEEYETKLFNDPSTG
jgi:predicted O-methyltransferase YrrM